MRHLKWAGLFVCVLVATLVLGHGGCNSANSEDQRAYDTMATLKTVEEFEKYVEQASRPVLVDFYATWCPPCKWLAPVIGSLAREYGDRVDFYRIDTDKAEDLARAMNIRSIPTVFIYVNGEPIHNSRGAAPRETYATALDEALRESQ